MDTSIAPDTRIAAVGASPADARPASGTLNGRRQATPLRLWLPFTAMAVMLSVGGCATPGPAHLYFAPAQRPAVIVDVAVEGETAESGARADVPSYVRPGERLVGLAYDPFTDHLFLRLAPGDRIRVVDRPARRIKRQFAAEGVPAAGDGDLAIRSRDRHLFLAHPTDPVVVETTLNGELVRTIALEAGAAPPAGVAYDQARDELLVLHGGDLAHVARFDLSGQRLGGVALDRDVDLTALAFDSAAREFYVPLRGGRAIGVFNETGHLQREVPLSAAPPAGVRGLDVGARSALRLF